MDDYGGILFEDMSDYARLRMYVKMAVIAMNGGTALPGEIVGIFDPDVLDEIGELYSAINGLRKRVGA